MISLSAYVAKVMGSAFRPWDTVPDVQTCQVEKLRPGKYSALLGRFTQTGVPPYLVVVRRVGRFWLARIFVVKDGKMVPCLDVEGPRRFVERAVLLAFLLVPSARADAHFLPRSRPDE